MSRRETRSKGELEHEVLACLAAADEPLTAAQVRGELGDDPAYTTIMTTLARLHAKHALIRTSRGRAYAYTLVGEPQDARSSMTAHRMHQMLDDQADRAGVLTRFVADLSAEDEDLLTALLADGTTPQVRKRARRSRS